MSQLETPHIPAGMTFREACALVAMAQLMKNYSSISISEQGWIADKAASMARSMEEAVNG